MNDPGLQDPISDVGQSVDGAPPELEEEREEERQFLDPSRWWFAATACPLIAGTFGPMANAFSIAALGSTWREIIPPGGSESSSSFEPDPKWLIAVNAVSLAFALIANASLLFNMAGRVPFAVAQPITVVGFFTAAFMLIGLVIAASREPFLGPHDNHALTQAFYYGIWAAAIYIIVACLMTLTVVGAIKGKYEKQFNLTTSQRTLMLQTISFMVYLFVGALIFSKVEGWDYLDAVYWADFTLLTIGIGTPLTPQTHTGRSLLIPFAIGGIVTVGLIIGSIRSMLLEAGKDKMRARATEKNLVKVDSWTVVFNHRIGIIPNSHKNKEDPKLPEKEQRRREFHAMRKLQKSTNTRSRWTSLGLSTLAACVLWFIGALVFMECEYLQGWSYFVSLYFSYTTLLTIGYGDFQPLSNSGRSFFVLWSLLAVPTLTVLISDMGDTVVKLIADLTNWVGTLTILPGEQGLSYAWKGFAKVVPFGVPKVGDKENKVDGKKVADQSTENIHPARGSLAHVLRERLGDDDIAQALEFKNLNDSDAADGHFYRWLMTREISRMVADSSAPRVKEYTYDEWAYFLRLLGHDEEKPRLHRRPKALHRRPKHPSDEPVIGHVIDHQGNLRPWSWLSLRSPLMSSKNEANWLLDNLVARLKREMESLTSDNDIVPPITLSVLDGLDTEGSGSESVQDGVTQGGKEV